MTIAAGGALGAVARFGLSTWLTKRVGPALPVGTLAVNVVGCLVIGLVFAWIESRPGLSPRWREFIVIGVLGSFTTFSTFGIETVMLVKSGAWWPALANVALNLLMGLAAVLLGLVAGRELAA